ncbi:hypothetical protein EVAR_16682_1 [Eumeta japonica]|uniref:Uncharacterized protein n=1 Tax=Eumeta variegata TaxID=151549 RepID=A0A4C1V5K4_EUMVA|nr:hypothetical protein EVAR_16682_1 [Eumeta japonica]
MYACYLYGLTLPPERTVISRTRLSFVITIQILVQMMEGKRQSSSTLNTRCDKKSIMSHASLMLSSVVAIKGRLSCTSSGRLLQVSARQNSSKETSSELNFMKNQPSL